MLVDSHCHLNFPELIKDIDIILENAKNANVGYMQTICTKITEFPTILALAEKYPHIFCSVGVHPNDVVEQGLIASEKIINYCQHKKVIGIGETGLDFYYEHSPRELQIQSFIEHIKAARETKLPIIIHTRAADQETMEILEEEMKKGKFQGLIHCFTATKELADFVLNLGLYISISGIVTFKKAVELQEVVKAIPIDRLLVETDAPYLAPVPYRGKRNEPAFVKHVAEFIANLHDMNIEEFISITTNNFFTLFNKAVR